MTTTVDPNTASIRASTKEHRHRIDYDVIS